VRGCACKIKASVSFDERSRAQLGFYKGYENSAEDWQRLYRRNEEAKKTTGE
jgi:hypothetical protein